MSRHLNTRLLARLDTATLNALMPHLAVTRLDQGRVLSETNSIIDKVYFPHSGVISCVVRRGRKALRNAGQGLGARS